MDRSQVINDLIRDEGIRLKPYRDTVGKLTIGVGRNLDDNGISMGEAMTMLYNDVAAVESEVRTAFPWFTELSPGRQRVIINMCFNLGLPKLLGFRNTLAAIERGDYAAAAAGMLDSKWASQVGDRAKRLANLMEQG